MKYVVGNNAPGYMPDSEPTEVESLADAVSALMFYVECSLMDMSDEEIVDIAPNEGDVEASLNKITSCVEELINRQLSINGGASVSLRDRVYWIQLL